MGLPFEKHMPSATHAAEPDLIERDNVDPYALIEGTRKLYDRLVMLTIGESSPHVRGTGSGLDVRGPVREILHAFVVEAVTRSGVRSRLLAEHLWSAITGSVEDVRDFERHLRNLKDDVQVSLEALLDLDRLRG